MKEVKKSKNEQIKVSIIMTLKDGSKYIKEALDSVLSQTLEDLEVVIIYAKSKDNSLEIVKQYIRKDNRINIYNEERPGIGAAKNLGIEKSKGEYITFLDSDDYYVDKNALLTMYDAIKKHDVKVCGALRNVLTQDLKVEAHPLHRALLIGFPNGRMFEYKNTQYDYHFHSYLYDRKMIIDSDARFAETKAYDDTHFTIRAMLKAEKFYVVPVELYCYRLHDFYAWKKETCYEALSSLIDELKITNEKELKICHYVTMQRISYEYGPLFEKYIKEGDLELLELLIQAQKEINNEYIKNMIERKPDISIIGSMDTRDYEIKNIVIDNKIKYIIAPLYDFIYKEKMVETDDCKWVYNSKSYKLGRLITWFPRKILKLIGMR